MNGLAEIREANREAAARELALLRIDTRNGLRYAFDAGGDVLPRLFFEAFGDDTEAVIGRLMLAVVTGERV